MSKKAGVSKKAAVKKDGAASRRVGRTAFVPSIVFRTLLKGAIPVVSATVLPACLAIRSFVNDAGADGTVDHVPDVGEAGDSSQPDPDGHGDSSQPDPDGTHDGN